MRYTLKALGFGLLVSFGLFLATPTEAGSAVEITINRQVLKDRLFECNDSIILPALIGAFFTVGFLVLQRVLQRKPFRKRKLRKRKTQLLKIA